MSHGRFGAGSQERGRVADGGLGRYVVGYEGSQVGEEFSWRVVGGDPGDTDGRDPLLAGQVCDAHRNLAEAAFGNPSGIPRKSFGLNISTVGKITDDSRATG